MAHVGIKRLGAGHAQEHAAKHQKAGQSAGAQIGEAGARIDREQHRGMLHDPPKPEHGHDKEPQRHDRAEGAADPRRSQRLDGEERNKDRHGRRQNVRSESRRDDVEPFERRKHRDRRRDGAVAIDQRSPEQSYRHNSGTVLPLDAEKRHKCQNSALAIIVDPHRERYVFDRRHDDERPDHQR